MATFLSRHIPRRLRAFVGGTIFGTDGTESRQIDVIVAGDLAVNFEQHDKMFVAAENVGCAVTVKSFLDRTTLEDALLNLASIPQMDDRVLSFLPPSAQESRFLFAAEYPSLVVFAFDGCSAETCQMHLQEILTGNPNVPPNRYPYLIIVNRKYSFTYHRRPAPTKMGNFVPAGTFALARLTEKTQGHPYAQVLTAISRYTGWLTTMGIDMDTYFRTAYGLPDVKEGPNAKTTPG